MRRRIFNSLHGTKSRFFAALRMTMLKVGFVLSQQSLQKRARKDQILVVALTTVAIVLGYLSGLFEWVHHNLHAGGHHELDALLPALLIIQLAIIWYAKRRHSDFRREVRWSQKIGTTLQAATDRNAQIIETLREEYFFYRRDANGIFEHLSASVEQLLGYSPEEFERQYPAQLTDHPVNQNAATHTELSLQGIQQPPYRTQFYNKNGERRDFVVTEAPVFDTRGTVIAVEGISRDVTQQLRLEAELRKSEVKFRSLVTSIPGMVYRAYPDWTIEIVSGSEKICGYSPDELCSANRNWYEIILPEDRASTS